MVWLRSTLVVMLALGVAFVHGDETDYESSSFGGSMDNVLDALRDEVQARELIPNDFYSIRDWASTLQQVANVIDDEVYPGLNSIDARSGRQYDAEVAQDPLEGSFFRPLINFLPSLASALRTGSLFLMAITEFLEDISGSLAGQRYVDGPLVGAVVL